jgi:hypothetical protein
MDETPHTLAKAACDTPSSSKISERNSPGWMTGLGMVRTSVVIDFFHLMRVAVDEAKADALVRVG